jgi:lipoprotein-releasing system permease protein
MLSSINQAVFQNKITVKNRAQLNESYIQDAQYGNIAVYLIFTLVL